MTQLTQAQLTSIIIYEVQQVQLQTAINNLHAAKGPAELIAALARANDALDKAKSDFMDGLSRKVQLAAPSDVQAIQSKLLTP